MEACAARSARDVDLLERSEVERRLYLALKSARRQAADMPECPEADFRRGRAQRWGVLRCSKPSSETSWPGIEMSDACPRAVPAGPQAMR
jgi:hypothetical protein